MSERQRNWLLLASGMALAALGQRLIRANSEALGLGRVQMMGLNAAATAIQRALL